MKILYYLIAFDLIALVIIVKLIFKEYKVFFKALTVYFSSLHDDIETLRKWEKQHDANHKMNLLYWFVLILGMLSAFIYFGFIA